MSRKGPWAKVFVFVAAMASAASGQVTVSSSDDAVPMSPSDTKSESTPEPQTQSKPSKPSALHPSSGTGAAPTGTWRPYAGYGQVKKEEPRFFVFVQKMGEDTTTATINGVAETLTFEDTTVYGFGGQQSSDYVGGRLSAFWGESPANATVVGGGESAYLTSEGNMFGLDVDLNVYFLKGIVRPVIGVGIGYIIYGGRWEGGARTASFNETDLSYNIEGGVQVDAYHLHAALLYRSTWSQIKDADSAIQMSGVRLQAGVYF